MFIKNLIESIEKKKSCLCVGLDPVIELFPSNILPSSFSSIKDLTKVISEFNKIIIDTIFDLVPIIKIQIAFYEYLGSLGYECYLSTIEYAHKKGLLVIGDVKRADISSTALYYAKAHLEEHKQILSYKFDIPCADAITVNPYFGEDCIKEFLKFDTKGIFVLVKTSNPSAPQIQEYPDKNSPLYLHLCNLLQDLNKKLPYYKGYTNLGVVVGATYPESLIKTRKLLKNTFFLVPGIGKQGGELEDLKNIFDTHGLGVIINVSRSIIYSYPQDAKDFDRYIRIKTEEYNHKINLLWRQNQ